MKIDVLTYNGKIDPESFAGKTAIVIDVLRCTSVIVNALNNGAERVIPVLEPEDAFAMAAKLGRDRCIIGGERGCNKVPGFDFGNSPSEYQKNSVSSKTVIISTSNGTAAIHSTVRASEVLIGAMVNSRACAKAAAEPRRDVLILCAGTSRRPSADDYCAAGAIINSLTALVPDCELSDMAMICVHLYNSLRSGSFGLLSTSHCRHLIELGYEKDIEFCLTEDVFDTVPVVREGIITLP